MKIIILILLLLLFPILLAAQILKREKIDLKGSRLDNFYRIDSMLYRSEQPTRHDFKILERFGIREVINMRNYHNDHDEAEGLGIQLHRIASKAGKISIDQLIDALRIIKEAQGPVLVHCWHGSDRTGAVIAMYRIVFQNVPREDAIREMTEGGFGFHSIYGNIIETINSADIKLIRLELGLSPNP